MSFSHGNLIHGDMSNTFQLRLGKIACEATFFNVSDGIPRQAEVCGNVLAGHGEKQVKDMAFKKPGVTFMLLGKSDFDLSCRLAIMAKNTANRTEYDDNPFEEVVPNKCYVKIPYFESATDEDVEALLALSK